MHDSKAVLHGCSDHWKLKEHGRMPLLFQMTVCVDVRILSPGEWTAFSYSSPHVPRFDLALQGDEYALHAWLLGVRHRFPVQLDLRRWHRLCLRWDALHNSFSLEVDGSPNTHQRTVIAHAIPPAGQLLLGCQPWESSPGVTMGTVELYLFRAWEDVREHGPCEDGSVVGWDSQLWGVTRARAMVHDDALYCGRKRFKREVPGPVVVTCNFSQFCANEKLPVRLKVNRIQVRARRIIPRPAKMSVCLQFTYKNTTCSVLLKLNKPIGICRLREQLTQGGRDPAIQVHLLGDVERVGEGAFYALQLHIHSTNTDFSKLEDKGVQLECHGSDKSVTDCMVVLQLGQPLDVDTVRAALYSALQGINHNSTLYKMGSSSDPDATADQLLNQTTDVSALNSSQVERLVTQLEDLLSAPNVSVALGRTLLSVIDNLLDSDAVASSSNRLIRVMDNLALKLIIQDQTETISAGSLALAATRIDGSSFDGTSFSISSPSGLQVARSRRASVRSTSPLGSITLPSSLTANLSTEEQQLASRVQFTFFQKTTLFQDNTMAGKRLNSHVLGASVANLSISGLSENVVFTLRNNEPVSENVTVSCVFWDFRKNGGAGGWNPDGCFAVQNITTENETICSCNHLTSFAVLLDLSGTGITDRLQARILTFITYIGCGISAIFLAVTLLSYLAFEKIRRDIPSKILIHLCFALLMLNLIFLLNAWLALYPKAVGLCISTAFFLHYFLLVSFTWMGLEALHMYLAIVKVFNNYMSRYMIKFSLVGWGIPLIVVIVVIAVDKNNYGLISYGKFSDGTSDDFCWLRNEIAFYVAVVAYFCVIFLMNLIMFIVVLVQLHRIKRQNPHNNQHRNGLHDLRSVAGLTFLLGLTWGFAFFAWGPVNLAFMYLFTIFNSFQGFFIFLFHCALKENVRRQWRIYLCCGRLRLPENAEWSRTATQTTSKNQSSVVTGHSMHSSHSILTQSSSRSSSMSSGSTSQPNGTGSPYEDNVITSLEDSNGDVVLNEMNSRHRSLRRT
ncbi:adhesion G-protein coupled receptor G2 [Chanos chanos]|uniref:Adhesion G-protein coupled receptor G2 n=1 Tax=Chanos chanos TaxID=29144 RepID=A0A6J2UUK5_CHACN|nr:adhesion G-protein coupled receptor G2 [Chanos chanos]